MGAALLQQLTPAQKKILAVCCFRTTAKSTDCDLSKVLVPQCCLYLCPEEPPGLQAAIFTGGIAIAGGQSLQQEVRGAQKEQQRLCAEVEQKEPGKIRRPKVAVDEVFAKRLYTILAM